MNILVIELGRNSQIAHIVSKDNQEGIQYLTTIQTCIGEGHVSYQSRIAFQDPTLNRPGPRREIHLEPSLNRLENWLGSQNRSSPSILVVNQQNETSNTRRKLSIVLRRKLSIVLSSIEQVNSGNLNSNILPSPRGNNISLQNDRVPCWFHCFGVQSLLVIPDPLRIID